MVLRVRKMPLKKVNVALSSLSERKTVVLIISIISKDILLQVGEKCTPRWNIDVFLPKLSSLPDDISFPALLIPIDQIV